MKTIQLSERELSIVYSLMAPPYRAEDIRSDEFNELRNKVFYALRDAQNDEPVSQPYKLPTGWVAVPVEPTTEMISSAMSDNKTGSVGEIYELMIAAAPQPPVSELTTTPDKWIPVSERMPEEGAYISAVSRHGEYVAGQVSDSWLDLHDGTSLSVDEVYLWMPLPPLSAAPQEGMRNRIEEKKVDFREEMDMGSRLTKQRFRVK
ncbi:DUF551 domain-containing protein [Citrobacter sp. CK202]|uniref:DUF551 domain-containing protein n=1 Tax=Citrobacter sp. CK202 TaxID=2985111 RepID=UPI002577224B|nr:DUF551 domain-containing protein [Citrobacter sp. CK202]MDM2960375.1 DUF551 domain-containing protein [Citrobacter sp. CK202]